jgi:homocysteine S-methyltransferase
MKTVRDLLADGRVHVVDGAMGTMLYGRGMFLNVCYDELNLKQPDLVRDIHRDYVRAGAELIETNTFGANPIKLATWGLAQDTERINTAAAALALEASGERAAVAGAIGPLGIRIEPFGEMSVDEARDCWPAASAVLSWKPSVTWPSSGPRSKRCAARAISP